MDKIEKSESFQSKLRRWISFQSEFHFTVNHPLKVCVARIVNTREPSRKQKILRGYVKTKVFPINDRTYRCEILKFDKDDNNTSTIEAWLTYVDEEATQIVGRTQKNGWAIILFLVPVLLAAYFFIKQGLPIEFLPYMLPYLIVFMIVLFVIGFFYLSQQRQSTIRFIKDRLEDSR